MWQWEYNIENQQCLHVNRDIARDRKMFLMPDKDNIIIQKNRIHTGEIKEVVVWRWGTGERFKYDDRIYLIPVKLFDSVKLDGLVRDVIAWCGQTYRDQCFPDDLRITATLRQIANGIGMAWNSRVATQLDDILAYARFFTIQNYRIIDELAKNGEVKKQRRVTFGFLDMIGRVTTYDGKTLSRNKQWYEIDISKMYATALRILPSAPLPIAAIEAAHTAPWRMQGAMKNMAYHLAARVPTQEVRLLIPTLQEILCRKPEKECKFRKTVESVLTYLNPVIVRDFSFNEGGYNITLNGKIVKN